MSETFSTPASGAPGGPFSGLDHVLVGVRDLEGARAAWTRLGFQACPRGRHIGWGTANYCLMFPHHYIELLGIVDPTQFVNRLDVFLETREGLMGVAFATQDPAATVAKLQAAGLACAGPKDLKRVIELPEGEVFPAFELVYPPPEATPGLSAFACRHLTPELVWRKAWLEHPNKAIGIAAVSCVVANPGELALAYARLFGLDAVIGGDGVIEVRCDRVWLRFLAPDAFQRRFPELPLPAQSGLPWLAALEIVSADLAATREYLNAANIPFVSGEDGGGLWVPPGETSGVILEFRPS